MQSSFHTRGHIKVPQCETLNLTLTCPRCANDAWLSSVHKHTLGPSLLVRINTTTAASGHGANKDCTPAIKRTPSSTTIIDSHVKSPTHHLTMYLLTLLTLLSGLVFTSAMPFTPYKHFGTSPHLDPSQAPEYCSAPPQTPSVKWCLWPNFAKQCYTRAYQPQPWCENFYQYESRPRSIGPDIGE